MAKNNNDVEDYSCNLNQRRFDPITGLTFGVRYIACRGNISVSGDRLIGSSGSILANAAQDRADCVLKYNTKGCNFLNGSCGADSVDGTSGGCCS